MLGRAVQLVVVAVGVVVVVWGDVAGVTASAEATPFCRVGPLGATCVFVNTTQEVEVGGGLVVAAGVSSRHPVKIPCPATLDVTTSSINITVGKAAAAAATGPSRSSQPSMNTTEKDVMTPQASSLNKTKTNVASPHVVPPGPSHASHPSLNTTETNVTAPQAAPSGLSQVSQPSLNTTETNVTAPQAAPSGLSQVSQPLLNPTETNVTAPLTAASDPSHASQPPLSSKERDVKALNPVFVGSDTPKMKNVSGVLPLPPPPPQECVVNVSVNHSTLHEIRGQFDAAQFENSKIVHLSGVYDGELSVMNSEVANISLSGKSMAIQGTKIELINDLKVERHLAMLDVEVGRVAAGGLLLHSSGREKPQEPHLLSHVTVGRMETESLVVAGAKVKITDMTVDALVKDAVTVRSGGMLTLTHVVLNRCEFFYCLSLERGARLVLRNTTIRNRTITKMDLQATSNANMYPLFALVSKDDRGSLQVTFPWYWIVIMAVCGVVAGLVIGSAIMWRRHTLRVSPASTLTLADLLSHDRLQEGNIRDHLAGNATSPHRRPTFARQDSGLTSSSFDSYVPFQTKASTFVTPTVTMSSEGD